MVFALGKPAAVLRIEGLRGAVDVDVAAVPFGGAVVLAGLRYVLIRRRQASVPYP